MTRLQGATGPESCAIEPPVNRIPQSFEKALTHALWGRPPNASALKEMSKYLCQLWPVLAQGRKGDQHYSLNAELTRAYVGYYLPANLLKMTIILQEMDRLGLDWRGPTSGECRWMDLGSGPGTAAWGAALAWGHQGSSRLRFWSVDQSPEFLKWGGRIARAADGFDAMEFHWEQKSWDAEVHTAARPLIQKIKPTVLSICNSWNEWSGTLEQRCQSLDRLLNDLRSAAQDEGRLRWLIVVEPGSRVASRDLLELREFLIKQPQLQVVLPCLDHRPCGARADAKDWCHEVHEFEGPAWHEELGRAAELRKEQMLFSYLVVAVGPPELLQKSVQWPQGGSRVVSQMMKEKGLTKCFLCTPGGKTMARVIHSRTNESNQEFLALRKGDLILTVELGPKGDVLGLRLCLGKKGPDSGGS